MSDSFVNNKGSLEERLRKRIEAIPPRDRDWYAVRAPWLASDMEPWITSGDMDPHNGMPVCNFDDAAIAGVDDKFSDDEWSDHNWAMAEFIETADPNAILSLLKEIAELREALKPFARAHRELEKIPQADRYSFSREELVTARAKLEGSGK